MGTLPALCWNKKDILPPHMPDIRFFQEEIWQEIITFFKTKL